MKQTFHKLVLYLISGVFLLQACNYRPLSPATPPGAAPVAAPAGHTPTPFQPLPPTSAAGSGESQTSSPELPGRPGGQVGIPQSVNLLWVDARLPSSLRSALIPPPGMSLFEELPGPSADQATLRLTLGSAHPVSHWVYALVAPFPTIVEGVSLQDLQQCWNGAAVGPFSGRPLLLDESSAQVFTALWGSPADGALQIAPAEELLARAWEQGNTWALVPFEALEPRWKVLEVDGQSPLRKDFHPDGYPLSVDISLEGQPGDEMARQMGLPASNRQAEKLTVLAMTGVTALVRATAFTMEQQGLLYPGRDVGDWLRSADLTHISNEVPFAKDCPFPNPVQPDMRFCSDPRYIALLEDVGTDIVELTGDHFQDWGAQAMYDTLDLYKERGWLYYGGGANLEEGRRAITVEHNGNRLAFIGCNGKGGSFAQAGPNRPGAVTCDFDWMTQEIARLRAEDYLPIATFQHFEYYTYQAQPNQKRDFGTLAKAGAVIVSGSQAHQPQAMAFEHGAFIHYGLGNLFFDQYEVSYATRQAFIDRHVFYNGRYIGTELLPILFVDYARPRPMTRDERNDLLGSVFSASGW
jgi:hypothetical protein